MKSTDLVGAFFMCQNSAEQVIQDRFSCRAYQDKPVPKEILEEILDLAKQAPSSTNMQPWEVLVISGDAKKKLDAAYLEAFDKKAFEPIDVSAYLDTWVEPFKSRRVNCGLKLYEAVGIDRKDTEARAEQSRKNFVAFGAPVVMIIMIPQMMKEGSIFDAGAFVQTLMLAAEAKGLNTCPQASLVSFPSILRELFSLSKDQKFITGVALGFGDLQNPVNSYRTDRVPVKDFTTFVD